MILTDAELRDLTGYPKDPQSTKRRYADQRRWLTDRGWLFEVAATGKPVVMRSYAEGRLGAMPTSKTWTPQLAAMGARG